MIPAASNGDWIGARDDRRRHPVEPTPRQSLSICHVWDADYPWDVRVEKVGRALVGAGHAVHIAARNRRREPDQTTLPEGTVHRMQPWHLLPRATDASLQFPAFFNPRWLQHTRRVSRDVHADVVLVRDLPLAPTAILAARRLGVPVVLDMAENYPAMMQSLRDSSAQRPFDWLVRNPDIVSRVERWVLPKLDHILVVVEESRERLMALGVPSSRITVVSNTPVPDRLDRLPARTHADGAPLRLIYLGLLEAPRGLVTLLHGVARALRDGVDVQLTLIGEGRARPELEAIVATANMGAAVTFRGFLPYADALAAVHESDVGVVPHVANESWNTTIPNKLFDYMAAGIPVLTSDARPVARIVTAEACGVVYRHDDPSDCARAVAAMAHAETRAALGRAGRSAVKARHHWGLDGARLVEAVERTVLGPR
jgi:glycosyltransferase involved in cell wall biosynthesis